MVDARQSRTRNLGVLALTAIAPLWGYGWVVMKVALDYARPFTFIALTTSLGAGGLFAVLLATRRPLRPPAMGWTIAIGLLQTTLFNSLAILALTVGGAGKVSVLVYTMPFWLLLLAWLFPGERLRGLQWPAVALAFAGLVLVVEPWDIGGVPGGVLASAAGLAWAGGSMLVILLQRRTRTDTLSLATWQMAFGAVMLTTIAVVTRSGWPDWTGAFVLGLVYSALLANALCWGLWVFALHSLPAGAAGLGTLAVPLVGVTASWIQLGEQPTDVEAAGMALIIAALAVLAAYGVRSGRKALDATGEELAGPPILE